jgi:hypothetical protein
MLAVVSVPHRTDPTAAHRHAADALRVPSHGGDGGEVPDETTGNTSVRIPTVPMATGPRGPTCYQLTDGPSTVGSLVHSKPTLVVGESIIAAVYS